MTRKNEYYPQSKPHPGVVLLEKLQEMGMSNKEFAVRSGKPEKTIIAVLKGTSSITPDMAVQFEIVTSIPASYWLNSQRNYDEFVARLKRMEVVNLALPWAASFPISAMIHLNWLPKVISKQEKASELLAFFGFAHHSAWEEYYLNQVLKVSFRLSLANTKEPYAISAWLRKGELQANELPFCDYNEQQFKAMLPELQALMHAHSDDYLHQLQLKCLSVGVKVVYTPCLPKAAISGATRWMNDTPLIQLSDRYKARDHFWFTFFHEVGHLLLHGKKEIFLENFEYTDKDLFKELEADAFAKQWLELGD